MLSLFPSLLSYEQFSPFVIRITLGVVFIFWAYRTMRTATPANVKFLGVVEALAGILLLIGLWTQLAAIIVGVDLVIRLAGRIQKRAFLTDGVNYYLLLLAMTASLLFTGAGWLAFDLSL